jgi:glyoxylase-like metal-dependent hydrolase (beta-lactamase superfamily II)
MEILELLALAVGLAIGGAAVLLLVAVAGRRAIPERLEINGVRILKDSFVTVCLLPLDGGDVALFDAGADRNAKAVLAELGRMGLGRENVKTIFLTHGHRDHIAGARQFPNAQVMALAGEVDVAEGRTSPGGPFMVVMPVKPSGLKVHRALEDGEAVELGSVKVRVFAVPGHTPGSAAYLVNGVLILGDAADAAKDGRVRSAPWLFTASRAENRASLRRLAERLSGEGSVQAMVFGHSAALPEGIEPLAAAAREW